MTLRSALTEASTRIVRRDAETLLAHILHRDRAWLLAHLDDELSPDHHAVLETLTSARAAGQPLQYVTGTQEFFGLALHVTPDVLIPRPETEHLVEAVLDWAHKQSDAQPECGSHLRIADAASSRPLRIADVGTGSGAIAIALASVLELATIAAIDLSPAALAIARANAIQHRVADRIHFVEADLLTPFVTSGAPGLVSETWGGHTAQAPFDVIASNPPYVALRDAETLAPEVRDHEPSLALYAGDDGLDIYRRLIPQAHAALRPGGLLAMEFGFGQRDTLAGLLANPQQAWHTVRFVDDYAGIPRVALAIRP